MVADRKMEWTEKSLARAPHGQQLFTSAQRPGDYNLLKPLSAKLMCLWRMSVFGKI